MISENVMEQLRNKPQELASEAREGEDLVQMIELITKKQVQGKGRAIEYISILMGNPSKYMPYEHISGKNVIADFFKSSNLMPIYTDEINTNFFTSKLAYKGEQFIKEVTNSYDITGLLELLVLYREYFFLV